MKEIKLTQGQIALVDDEDFEFLNQWKWHERKINKIYYYAIRGIRIKDKIKFIYMHRLIMNTPTGFVVDHLNHNGLDNQKSNLRNCTQSENIMNQKCRNKSGYKGVYYFNGKIIAKISINRKVIHLGYFKNGIKAAEKYNEICKAKRGNYAILNL